MFKNRSFLVKLVNDKDAPESEPVEEVVDVNKIKDHFQKYSFLYGIGIASFTYLIMRERNAGVLSVPDGSDGITIRPLTFLSNRTNVVTVISRGTQGPPSWVVRCKETGEIFVSQIEAARSMNIPPSILSSHLNGKFDDALGHHFERICMAA